MPYKPFPYFIYRTPFLSTNELDVILSNKERLSQSLLKKQIKEAIFLGSPVLFNEINKVAEELNKDLNEINRILLSCVRYISRMSTRCTPFGLFAGCGIGVIGDKTDIILDNEISRTTRLDMSYLTSLYDTLTKIPEIKERIRYFPNTSLYRVGKNYRYVETIYKNTGRKYQIAEIRYSSYLNKILKNIQHGANIETIASMLIKTDEISEEDALDFIDELIASNIIVAELSQSVTGDDYLTRIIKLLEEIDYNGVVLGQLENISALLKKLDTDTNSENLYEQIQYLIKTIKSPYDKKFLFQVDMVKKDMVAVLGSNIIDEIQSTLTLLNKITPSGRNETLYQFQKDFYNRYEEREIPLMEALDPDIGIGYPSNNNTSVLSPLVDDWVFPQQKIEGVNRFQSVLFQKVMFSLNQRKTEIELTDKDVEGMKANWRDLPATICVMIEIKAESQDLLIRWNSCGGSSAANLLARFAHTDKRINQHVRTIVETEQKIISDVVLAEIVHSPEARTGNILSRPHLRDHEILYLSDTDLPEDKIIKLSDLFLSIKKDRLTIRSKKLNKEVIPRLTTAHNYHYPGTMPVYRFLCDMQVQTGRNALYFNWGQQFGKGLPFLPRVRYRNTILFPATWVINCEEIKYLFGIKEDNLLIETVSKWRNTHSIPCKVLMPDGDNELFVNWENPLSIRSLFSIIKKRQTVKFTEFLFEPDSAVIKDKKGVYTNEFVVTFHQNSLS